jgi:hypothetical protein
MRTGSAPAWAVELTQLVCAEAQAGLPRVLRWRRAARDASTGLTNRRLGSIAVTAGDDAADARHTLLHELAHWLTPEIRRRRRGQRVHHGAAFYGIAIPLYRLHQHDLLDALRREVAHYPSVLRHAAGMGLPEAATLVAERRELRHHAYPLAGRAVWRIQVPEHSVRLVREGRWYVCASCGRRLIGRALQRAARRGARERHTLWTRLPLEAAG